MAYAYHRLVSHETPSPQRPRDPTHKVGVCRFTFAFLINIEYIHN